MKLADRSCFIVGLACIFLIVGSMWAGYVNLLIRDVIPLIGVEATVGPYQCRDVPCDRCLTQIDRFPNGIVLTGASAAAYSIDVPLLQAGTSRPIVDCMMNNVQLDSYDRLVNVKNTLSSSQIFIGAINSWLMVSAPDPSKTPAQFGPTGPSHEGVTVRQLLTTLRHAYIRLWIYFADLQRRWRLGLHSAFPRFADAISFIPLPERFHSEAKAMLLRRWIRISPAANAIMYNVDRVPSDDELRMRLNRLREIFRPIQRFTFFNLPELTDVTQAQRRAIFDAAKARFVAIAGELGMTYVEVNYTPCKLTRDDFWNDFQRFPYILDPIHINSDAKARITECVRKALSEQLAS